MTENEILAERNKIDDAISSAKLENTDKNFVELEKELKANNKDINILPITFTQDAQFKLPVKVEMDVKSSGLKDGTYYLYYINPKTNKYEYNTTVTVKMV